MEKRTKRPSEKINETAVEMGKSFSFAREPNVDFIINSKRQYVVTRESPRPTTSFAPKRERSRSTKRRSLS